MGRKPDKKKFLDLLEKGSLSNEALQTRLDWDDEKYERIKDSLFQDEAISISRGRSGVVNLQKERKRREIPFKNERELYSGFKESIVKYICNEFEFSNNNILVEDCAHKGRAETGGKWSRPDIALLHIESYPALAKVEVSVYTFEVKYHDADKVQAVYEALAHKRIGNMSFVALYRPRSENENINDSKELHRMISECNRLGVGLVTFKNPKNHNTYEMRVIPSYESPNPNWQNAFIERLRPKTKKEVDSKILDAYKNLQTSKNLAITPENLRHR